MPSGVAPLVILDAQGAALAAAMIFGLSNPAIREKVAALQADNRSKLMRDDQELNP